MDYQKFVRSTRRIFLVFTVLNTIYYALVYFFNWPSTPVSEIPIGLNIFRGTIWLIILPWSNLWNFLINPAGVGLLFFSSQVIYKRMISWDKENKEIDIDKIDIDKDDLSLAFVVGLGVGLGVGLVVGLVVALVVALVTILVKGIKKMKLKEFFRWLGGN